MCITFAHDAIFHLIQVFPQLTGAHRMIDVSIEPLVIVQPELALHDRPFPLCALCTLLSVIVPLKASIAIEGLHRHHAPCLVS